MKKSAAEIRIMALEQALNDIHIILSSGFDFSDIVKVGEIVGECRYLSSPDRIETLIRIME